MRLRTWFGLGSVLARSWPSVAHRWRTVGSVNAAGRSLARVRKEATDRSAGRGGRHFATLRPSSAVAMVVWVISPSCLCPTSGVPRRSVLLAIASRWMGRLHARVSLAKSRCRVRGGFWCSCCWFLFWLWALASRAQARGVGADAEIMKDVGLQAGAEFTAQQLHPMQPAMQLGVARGFSGVLGQCGTEDADSVVNRGDRGDAVGHAGVRIKRCGRWLGFRHSAIRARGIRGRREQRVVLVGGGRGHGVFVAFAIVVLSLAEMKKPGDYAGL